jgi:hypothetical protein
LGIHRREKTYREKFAKQGLPSLAALSIFTNYFSDAVWTAGGNNVAPRRHDTLKLCQSEFE